ncbi:conserved membrane protein of unknown function [Ruminococcaceae bacterium BL-6]|nr:conserved membrane protein of unknown function [Ruminococcaceae bacterium BL-6]
MSPLLRISLCVGIAVYFTFIIIFLRKKALALKYTILWIVSGFLMLLVVLFPRIINYVSKILGIVTPANAVFTLELFFLIVILMSITSIVSKLDEKMKKMIQYTALLEKRIRELEEKLVTSEKQKLQR